MSETDLQDLIHENMMRAFEKGQQAERERIIKLLEQWGEEAGCFCCASDVAAYEIIELIKGEQK